MLYICVCMCIYIYIYIYHIYVVVCTDLSDKELHRQVGVGIVVTPRKPTRCNGTTLARNARDAGSIPSLGT